MSSRGFTLTVFSDRSPVPVLCGGSLRLAGFLQGLPKVQGVTRVSLSCPVPVQFRHELESWCGNQGIELSVIGMEEDALTWPAANSITFFQHAEEVMATRSSSNNVAFVFGHRPAVILGPLAARFPMVTDIVDECTPHLWRQVGSQIASGKIVPGLKQLYWLKLYQRAHADLMNYRAVIVTAHDDARRLSRFVPELNIVAVPNGVTADTVPPLVSERTDAVALFHGALDYPPNEKSALYIVKEIAPHVPLVRFDIVGRGISESLQRSAGQQKNVRIVGAVPVMADVLRAARFGVYPVLTRTGIQNKLLEAWAHGLPVITTRRALDVIRAYDQGAETSALCALSGAEFTDAIRTLENNPQLCSEMALRGRELVLRSFDWSAVAARLASLCMNTL
jgi:glycosyltransferase involved in cell wall biosynthesis